MLESPTLLKEYKIQEVAKIIKGTLAQSGEANIVEKLSFDSRSVLNPPKTLFFAIKGNRLDGHQFLTDLYKEGVRNFVVTKYDESWKEQLPEANVVKVTGSIDALQRLTTFHRKRFDLPVIGITGSNGKTIVKEWLFQLLEDDFSIVKSPKSYNSQIGVPISVWQIKEDHTLGIFEAGISQPGEMERLEKVIAPEIGIFTNIGEAHAEGFLNIKHKVKEKLKLFVNSKILIYCADYPEIINSLSEIKNLFLSDEGGDDKFRLFTWSMQADADLRITKIQKKPKGCDIYGLYKNSILKISIPFSDDASIENAIHCWATLLYLKVDSAKIEQRFLALGKISMRLELKTGINNCSLINDSYNSDTKSLAIALDFLDQQHQHENKTVILSDILQTGKDDYELYQEIQELLKKRKINRIIGIGKSISNKSNLFSGSNYQQNHFFESTEEFLKRFHELDFQNETILLKGARKFQFERISRLLEQKTHKTLLEINLNALVHNLQIYDGMLQPDTKIMAMVKAFSYGSGSYEIANVLQYHRVNYLTVAYVDEGISLRRAGITLPIMVMNPAISSFDAMISFRLEPEIYSFSILREFDKALQSHAAAQLSYPVHIKIDTGMHRLGFNPSEIPDLIETLKDNARMKVQSVFSHLAGSEEKNHDDFSKLQIETFDEVCQSLKAALPYQFIKHLVNSAGMVRFPEAQYDMVRLGIGLYGVDITGEIQDKLQQVSTLKSTISQIKTVKKGETVGYGRSYQVTEDRVIATIGIGYADGVDRRLGNGNGSVLIKDASAPIIGNVCMDMCMIDITNIKEVQEGDEVILFGEGLTIQEVAKQAGTIPYELLTGISSRVKRIYFQE